MKERRNKSSKKNQNNKNAARKLKKKCEKAKKKLAKPGKGEKNSHALKKSSFSYSLKKYQHLPLREKMLEKLKASRFRYINEQLYTMKSKEAFNYFKNDTDAFLAYHEGYKKQTHSWQKNPIDIISTSLKKLLAANRNIVIGDFGCGDAKLAKSLADAKVHSFDLVSLDPCVTVCDMANTPLENETLDVAVFCLSIMGTNASDYLVEANRVLKNGGILKVAEVQSRFDNIQEFIEKLSRFGFKKTSLDSSSQLFYIMDFQKERNLGKKFKKKSFEVRVWSRKIPEAVGKIGETSGKSLKRLWTYDFVAFNIDSNRTSNFSTDRRNFVSFAGRNICEFSKGFEPRFAI